MSWISSLRRLGNEFTNLRIYAPFALFLLALLPRLLSLNAFITWDEPMWAYRSIRFLAALLRGDLADTFLVGHPGVITMICGAVGIAVRRFLLGHGAADFDWLSGLPALDPRDVAALRRLATFLPAAKLPMAVLNAACVAGIYLLARRLFDAKVAFVAALLLALDPFHLALSRVLHLDAPAANFMILSLLSLLLHLRRRSRPYLILSGALAGPAFLSKSYSLFLVPFTGLLLAAAYLKQKRFREAPPLGGAQSKSKSSVPLAREGAVALSFAFWCLVAGLAFCALWPAMWADPAGTVRGVLDTALGYAATPYETSKFFLGKAVDDPGPLFYPVVLAFRTTPLVWLGLLAAILHEFTNLRIYEPRRFEITALLACACLFAAFMSLGAKKFDRYMLPAVVALDVVAAVGLVGLGEFVSQRFGGRSKFRVPSSKRHRLRTLDSGLGIFIVLLLLQAGHVLSYHPHYLACYNPLLGGPRLASRVLPMGWGEGMDLAADHLNRKGDAEELVVATGGIPGFAPLFKGQVKGSTERDVATSDYTLLYISDVQQNPAAVGAFGGQRLEHVVRIHGVDYVWIFANTQHEELASYLQGRVGPDDAVLLDASSPLVRYYQGPCHILDSARSEAEVAARLREVAAGHRRLWYVAYPEGDPQGWLNWQLSAHALLVKRRGFPQVSLSCYLLPAQPAFGVTPLRAGPNVEFGGRLRLTGWGFAEDVVEYRQKLGVALRWQALQKVGENYALSLRLVDGGGHPWAQVDEWLLNASGLPTSAWEEGEASEGRYLLDIPAGIPPGRYQVRAIVYRTDTLERLAVLDEGGSPAGTEYALGTVSVASPTVPPTLEELAIPLPLSRDFGGRAELLGYSLSALEARPGDTVELTLFWRALRPMERDYDLLLELRDGAGRTWMEARLPLPNESYPTSRWRPGEVLRTPYDLLIEPAIPAGRYRLFVNLLDGDRPVEESSAIAELSVQGRERLFAVPEISFPLRADIAHRAALLGYDLDRTSVEPGGVLQLTLYWQALARMETSYTVFTHLLDAEGRVRGQKDSMPCGGACPTTGWLEGEVIVDRYEIAVDPDAPAGEYQIEVGMYDPQTLRRLPAFDEAGKRLADDRILLGRTIIVGSGRKQP